MVLNTVLGKTQVSKTPTNSVWVEQLMWHRADADHIISRCSPLLGCSPLLMSTVRGPLDNNTAKGCLCYFADISGRLGNVNRWRSVKRKRMFENARIQRKQTHCILTERFLMPIPWSHKQLCSGCRVCMGYLCWNTAIRFYSTDGRVALTELDPCTFGWSNVVFHNNRSYLLAPKKHQLMTQDLQHRLAE